jgi:hypothetical protein
MHQQLKLAEGSLHGGLSRYCPLDLFSHDAARVRHALQCLLETPQNNLQIFHNNQTIVKRVFVFRYFYCVQFEFLKI